MADAEKGSERGVALWRRPARMCRIDGPGITAKVLEVPFNDRRRLDAGDDAQPTAALPADLDVNGKDALEALCPAHRPLSIGGRCLAALVGSVGDSYERESCTRGYNPLAETIIGLYKTKLIRQRGPWKNIDEVEYAPLEWIDWFNNSCLFQPIGDVLPAAFEMAYYRQQEESAIAA